MTGHKPFSELTRGRTPARRARVAAKAAALREQMTLEECMEYIQQDECIEVTPKKIRLRKVILDEEERKRSARAMKAEETR